MGWRGMKETRQWLSEMCKIGRGNINGLFCICIIVIAVIIDGVEVDEFDRGVWGGARVG